MPAHAALGFRLHTGWAALVVVAGAPRKFQVLLRRRIELVPPGDSVPRFVYHKASELPLSQAAELVRQVEAASREMARTAFHDILGHLRTLDFVVKAAGIPSSSRLIPEDLAAVLRSHPLIHTAEAALFRQALTSACNEHEVPVVSVREREVWFAAAGAWKLKEAELRKQVDGLRKSLGAPWGTDQKTATAMALFALQSVR